MAEELHALFDEWHSTDEPFDPALETEMLRQKADAIERLAIEEADVDDSFRFRSSSAGSDPRELYEKMRGSEEDPRRQQPHQGRWTRIGTALGDTLQRDLLYIEKHHASPMFVPDRTERGEPAWEEFMRARPVIQHAGYDIAMKGEPDGVLKHIDEDGVITRVGLEVKSKSTTPARTSEYSMRAPEPKHVEQVTQYSIMYGVSHYLIVYGNVAKKSWFMDETTYAKNPDLRVFPVYITDADRKALLDKYADVLRRVDEKQPPPLDLSAWTFNGFKRACATSLTDEEMADLESQVDRMKASNIPAYEKAKYTDAWADILRLRGEDE